MKVDEKVLERLRELVQAGERVIATRRSLPPNYIGFNDPVDSEAAYQWFTSVQSILVRVFGETSEHYRNFTAQETSKGLTITPVRKAQGVLKAAVEDYEGGYLLDLRKLVEAEVLDDFLDQAAALLAAGYYQPAAVVGGCVLEDALRALAATNGIALPSRPKLDLMNAELAKAGRYTKLVQKRITAIADVRNNAAHGHWDQFTEDDVRDALQWIRNFVTEQLA